MDLKICVPIVHIVASLASHTHYRSKKGVASLVSHTHYRSKKGVASLVSHIHHRSKKSHKPHPLQTKEGSCHTATTEWFPRKTA